MNASETFCSGEFATVHRLGLLNVFYGVTKITMSCWMGKSSRRGSLSLLSLVECKLKKRPRLTSLL